MTNATHRGRYPHGATRVTDLPTTTPPSRLDLDADDRRHLHSRWDEHLGAPEVDKLLSWCLTNYSGKTARGLWVFSDDTLRNAAERAQDIRLEMDVDLIREVLLPDGWHEVAALNNGISTFLIGWPDYLSESRGGARQPGLRAEKWFRFVTPDGVLTEGPCSTIHAWRRWEEP